MTTATSDKRKQQILDAVHRHRAAKRDCKYGPPENIRRRRRLEKDTAAWLKYYLGPAFPLPWSEFHLRYISDLDYIAEHGGWKAEALPRGSGKTTIAEGAALKYLLTGQSRFLALILASGRFAKQSIKKIQGWLRFSERLAADYPEVCAVIRFTKGVPQAMKSVTANGEPVEMEWTAQQIVFPDCPLLTKSGQKKTPASINAIVRGEGITGAVRGMNYENTLGQIIRPDLAIVDDPQTRESAKSSGQITDRKDIIKSDVALLAGPSKDIRIIIPCTIIEPNDLAAELTDVELNPDFLGERQPFFLSMPENMELWEQYNVVRKEGLSKRDQGYAAARFYRENYAELTKGAEVYWLDRKGDNAIDGIQWGMDQYFKLGPKGFASELQNAPLGDKELIKLNKQHVLDCETKFPRWKCQNNSVAVVAFIDLNPRTVGLFWSVISFENQLCSRVIAYGNFPGKNAPLVPAKASDQQEDAILFEGLRKLAAALAEAPISRDDGSPAKIDLLIIDGGYNFSTVCRFVQAARFPFQVAADRGRASTKYLDTGKDVVKAMQFIHLRKNQNNQRYLSHNSDAIREIVHRAFLAGPDAPGGIAIHKNPPVHDEFAESIISQRLIDKAEGVRGVMYRWGNMPGGQDHLLDCVVGCYAGAYWFGVENYGTIAARGPKRRGLKIRKSRL